MIKIIKNNEIVILVGFVIRNYFLSSVVFVIDKTIKATTRKAPRVKEVFNISDNQYEDIKSVYFDDLDKYYKILNCTLESTPEEIKSSYKKLVKNFHPDTIISKGLPEEFIEFASSRFREIQESYEKIRQERNF